MANTLDFNVIVPHSLPLVMRDPERTKIDVLAPTEGLVEELEAVGADMKAALESNEEASIPVIYDLAARLISCNRQGLQVTAEDLGSKYRMNLESMLIFYGAYVDFIDEITKAKN